LDRYAMPSQTDWAVPSDFETAFRFEYEDGRAELLNLYRKGKRLQWDAAERIDWSQDLDPENPEGLPDSSIPIFGWSGFAKLTSREKADVRRHYQAWQLSQFLHGEQGALICTAKIVQQVPHLDAKLYAATQVWTKRDTSKRIAACCTRSSSSPTPSIRSSAPCWIRSCATHAGT
jgi:hypothetical protein